MVSKLNTDKTYLEKDKFKSPKALPVTYIITLVTTIHISVSYTHLTLPTNREV